MQSMKSVPHCSFSDFERKSFSSSRQIGNRFNDVPNYRPTGKTFDV